MDSVSTCPTFSEQDCLFLLQNEWGIVGTLKPLDSYLDQNFLVKTASGEKYVLKIANAETPDSWLDLQNKALQHLKAPEIPNLVYTLSNNDRVLHQNHWWRVLEFLEGTMLSTVSFRSEKLLKNIGVFAGKCCEKLTHFSHPAAERAIQWDLQNAPILIKEWIKYVQNKETQSKIEQLILASEKHKNKLASLRKSTIHADLTRYNLLLDASGNTLQGLIDFGDICHTWTCSELAVLVLESAMTGSLTPYKDAFQVVGAFHNEMALHENELELLYFLIQLRSAIIVCASARQLQFEPQNEYVRKQAIVDEKMFLSLGFEKNDFATQGFKIACGMDVSIDFSFFEKNDFAPLTNEIKNWKKIEISPKSAFYDNGIWENGSDFYNLIQKEISDLDAFVPFQSVYIRPSEQNLGETPTITLGTIVFGEKGSTVFAPSSLEFVDKQGSCSVFKMQDFYLKIDGLDHNLESGNTIEKASLLGTIGNQNELSFLPSHLFFQIATTKTIPILVKPSELAVWETFCVKTEKYLGLPAENKQHKRTNLIEKRAEYIQQAQEYYYQKPMNLVRAWKQYLIDDNGQVYLDAINNVAHIGHSHPKITDVVFDQMKKINTNARFLYEENIDYAEKIISHFPAPLSVVFFTCTGSEANDLALRLARSFTNEQDVVVIDGEYHGNTTAVDEISSCLMDNPTASKSARTYTHPLIQPNTFRGKYTDTTQDVATLYAQDVAEKIDFIKNQGRGVAAFISESLLGSGGGVEMPKGYLKKVYDQIHQAGGLCIADEVQIGFGRMGTHFWGFEKEGVQPDIVTLGKPMGNGFPISAVVTTKKIAEAYQKKYTYFNTYAGNPVACRVASTVLDVIEEEKLQENAAVVGNYLKNNLTVLIAEFDCVGAVYGHAMYLGVDIVLDKKNREPDSSKALLICEAMKQKGIIIYPTGDFYNILKIKPPMCFNQKNADYLVQSLRDILNVIENG